MEFCLLTGVSGAAELLSALLIFALVLAVTYLTTRFVGSYEKQKMAGSNIRVVESVRLPGGKSLDLVKAGDKYLLLGESKDTLNLLCELTEDSIIPWEEDSVRMKDKPDFRKILQSAGEKFHLK